MTIEQINTESLTIEKWRPIAADTFPALYIAHVVKGLIPQVKVIPLRDAVAHVFSFDVLPALMILNYDDGKPICFRRR